MEAHEFARKLYQSGAANSASSVLQGLRHQGLIECSDEMLHATTAFGHSFGSQQETCSCLVAASMAAGLAAARAQDRESGRKEAEKISENIFEEFRNRFKTTRCAEILAGCNDDLT